MQQTFKIACVVGTRPEAIKMAPVIKALRAAPWADVHIVATAQHRQMLDQTLALFGLEPDVDLDLMRPNQSLPDLTARVLQHLSNYLDREKPAALLAQGDTTTVMSAALAAFYQRIPFGHVEAGLRTGDPYSPFPEEMNRVLASRLARWHFAPTESSRQNLLAEGISEDALYLTGNTVIDALLEIAERCDDTMMPEVTPGRRLVLITSHRRENFGAKFEELCRAIVHLANAREDTEYLYPVHPNPNVRATAFRLLEGHPRIRLCEPLDYLPFVAAMKCAYLILSDSGGVQEEAPALGKPVLVLREKTERPEAVTAGVVKLVGCDFDTIVEQAGQLLDDAQVYSAMARGVSPYGDGQAAPRIVSVLEKSLAKLEAR